MVASLKFSVPCCSFTASLGFAHQVYQLANVATDMLLKSLHLVFLHSFLVVHQQNCCHLSNAPATNCSKNNRSAATGTVNVWHE